MTIALIGFSRRRELAASRCRRKIRLQNVLTGQAAFIDGRAMKPGTFRKVTVDALPPPFATSSSANPPRLVPRPANAWPQAPAGFKVELVRHQSRSAARRSAPPPTAISSSPKPTSARSKSSAAATKTASRSRFRSSPPASTSPSESPSIRAAPIPQYVYVGDTNAVVRFPYRNGDLKATGPAEEIVPHLPTGGHSTRDIAFSPRQQAPVRRRRLRLERRRSRHAIPANSTAPTFSNTRPTANSPGVFGSGIRNPRRHRESIPPPAKSGAPPTNATRSATTSSPTTSPTSSKAASTAGPGITSEAIPIRASKASIPN